MRNRCRFPTHTVLSAYAYGCRCDRCVPGWNEYQQQYRAAHSERLNQRHRERRAAARAARPARPDPLARFKVRVKIARNRGGCWLWHGPLNNVGYAKFEWRRADGSRGYGAHCFAWEHYRNNGQRPAEGYELDHLCFVRHCCNPAHLEPVTRDENIRRSLVRQREQGWKLNTTSVKQIRKRYAAGESPTAMAQEFSVVAQTIHDVVANRTWRLDTSV